MGRCSKMGLDRRIRNYKVPMATVSPHRETSSRNVAPVPPKLCGCVESEAIRASNNNKPFTPSQVTSS